MRMGGIDIVIQLKLLKKQGKPCTQRWLLDKLREDGFPTLSESTLSSILNEHYKNGNYKEILKTAENIVTEALENNC